MEKRIGDAAKIFTILDHRVWTQNELIDELWICKKSNQTDCNCEHQNKTRTRVVDTFDHVEINLRFLMSFRQVVSDLRSYSDFQKLCPKFPAAAPSVLALCQFCNSSFPISLFLMVQDGVIFFENQQTRN